MKLQKAGTGEESGGRGHEPEPRRDPWRKQMLRHTQGPVLDRCQGHPLTVESLISASHIPLETSCSRWWLLQHRCLRVPSPWAASTYLAACCRHPCGVEGPDPAPHRRGAPCPSQDPPMAAAPLAAGSVTRAGEHAAACGPCCSCRGPGAVTATAPAQPGGAAGPGCVMPRGHPRQSQLQGGFVAKPSQAPQRNPVVGRAERSRPACLPRGWLSFAHQQALLSSSLPHTGCTTVPLLPQRGSQLGCWESSCLRG